MAEALLLLGQSPPSPQAAEPEPPIQELPVESDVNAVQVSVLVLLSVDFGFDAAIDLFQSNFIFLVQLFTLNCTSTT